MQAAAEETAGTMAAVLGLGDNLVDEACRRVEGDVWVANYNAPGQVVTAGDPDALVAAGEVAKELGAKRVMPIKVGGAFHTPFMAPAQDYLKKCLAETELRAANRPVFANIDAEAHTDASDWANRLVIQLTSPVQWRRTLHVLDQAGATVSLELGPGTVLTGMVKRGHQARSQLTG